MTTDFYMTSDSIVQNRIREEMDRMRAEILRVENEIKEAENELNNFYEKARRKGIPPGWIRD